MELLLLYTAHILTTTEASSKSWIWPLLKSKSTENTKQDSSILTPSPGTTPLTSSSQALETSPRDSSLTQTPGDISDTKERFHVLWTIKAAQSFRGLRLFQVYLWPMIIRFDCLLFSRLEIQMETCLSTLWGSTLTLERLKTSMLFKLRTITLTLGLKSCSTMASSLSRIR